MTDEKALKILKSIEILAFRDKKKKYFMKDVCDAQKVSIKALEQGPILDKIRTEIEALTDGAKPERIWNVDALAIIDKYKAESEV